MFSLAYLRSMMNLVSRPSLILTANFKHRIWYTTFCVQPFVAALRNQALNLTLVYLTRPNLTFTSPVTAFSGLTADDAQAASSFALTECSDGKAKLNLTHYRPAMPFGNRKKIF